MIQHIDVHRTAQPNAKTNNCKISRNGVKVEVEPDTGADANAMDKWQFNELMRKAPNLKIRRHPHQVENPD